MEATSDHERDFIGWTESQAGILRAMPAGAMGLDTQNLAEEIEDLGRSEIRAASSLLRQLLVHLLKLAVQPHLDAASHWVDDALVLQNDALLAAHQAAHRHGHGLALSAQHGGAIARAAGHEGRGFAARMSAVSR